jgi:hypothetical protein
MAAAVGPGAILHQGMRLPPGRWELSLSYSSPVRLRFRAGSLDTRMPAQAADLSAVWRVGEIDSAGAPLDVRLELDPLHRLQADGPPALIGRVAAVPVGKPGRFVPAARACGRYVDWLRPGR